MTAHPRGEPEHPYPPCAKSSGPGVTRSTARMAVSGYGSRLISGAHPFCYEDRSRESQASLVLLLDASNPDGVQARRQLLTPSWSEVWCDKEGHET